MTIQRMTFNNRPNARKGIPTFEQVMARVKQLGLSQEIVDRLANKVRAMPPGAYGHFLKNINHHIDLAGKENGKQTDAS